VDDGEVFHDPDNHVAGFQVRDADWLRRLRKKMLSVDERSVGVGAQEILCEEFCESLDIRVLD
jgi:hypothetical protein